MSKDLIYLNKAIKAHAEGNLKEAKFFYLKAIEINPNNSRALGWLGTIEAQNKNFCQAEKLLLKALEKEKNNSDFLLNYANILFEIRKYDDAIIYFQKVNRHRPADPIVLSNLASCYNEINQPNLALKKVDRSIQIKPDYPESWCIRGNALIDLGRYEEALKCYERTLILKPDFAEAWSDCGNALNNLERYEEALIYFKKAIELNSNYAKAWNDQGISLLNLKRFIEALDSFNRAITIRPNYAEAWSNSGQTLESTKSYLEAVDCYRKAINIDSNYVQGILNYGVLQLHLLSFDEGWRRYEARLRAKSFNPLSTNKPIWKGEKNAGRLLIWAEQGIGDQILYGSLFQELVQFPQKKIIFLNSKLIPIFKRSFPEFLFLEGDQIYHEDLYDEQIPIGSLGQFFRKNKEDFKNSTHPYLLDDPIKTQCIKSSPPFSNQKTCGISWRSANQKLGKDKSVSLEDLLPILSMNDMQFVNLQYGDTAKEVTDLMEEHGQSIYSVPEVDIFNDIDGVLSIISACDLIITTSNSTAHLAGALGKETLLLIPYSVGKFWYWHDIDGLSLWYPSVRVFPQTTQGEWADPINAIKTYLEKRDG